MDKADIFSDFTTAGLINDGTATQFRQFTKIPRGSLLSDQANNRGNASWGRGEYVVAYYTPDAYTTADFLRGWGVVTKKHKNQYLLLEIDNAGHWEMYDCNGVLLGDTAFIQDFLDKLSHKKGNLAKKPLQKIFFGAPGSGKSTTVKKMLSALSVPEDRIFRTTFHPDTDYSSFVGSYKPQMKGVDIEYVFIPQIFTDAYVKAWNDLNEDVYLVIEEINRGNCAQIFGDLFQLLDRSHGVSDYPIKAAKDLALYLENADDGHGNQILVDKEGIKNGCIVLPSNLSIIATMNTSDQSLFPMDSAFKRRWDWEYVPIEYDNADSDFTITLDSGKRYKWNDFLREVNKRILDVTTSEDKQLGNFFIKSDVREAEFKSKVLFYIWSEVCKEEYNTDRNFFRVEDAAGDISEFTFNDLYDKTTPVSLDEFMSYLKIASI